MQFDRATLAHNQATAERYHQNLSPQTYDYLSGRGITGEVIERFMLGTCDDIYDGWLAIPYLRPSGVIGFKFRCPYDHKCKDLGHSKYKNQGATHLFNTADFEIADQTGEIAISEGELDAIVSSALCDVPTVGIPGATQWTGNPHWHELFRGYRIVWILADPDEAGFGLASTILDTLSQARLVKLPGDVNETYLAYDGIKEFVK